VLLQRVCTGLDGRQGGVVTTPQRELPRLATTDEVATMLRTTRKAVYSMAERGQLPGVTRIGRRMLFRMDELLHWLDQKRAPSPKE
jgi:excisionase family DNA binding protein